jgi:hypothetical protein
MDRLLIFAAVVASGLLASCSASGGAGAGLGVDPSAIGCRPASSAYRELFENGSITGGSVESDILVKESAIQGAWYIVAQVEASAAVWVTDRDPQRAVVGHITSANDAAQKHSNWDFVDGPMSRSTMVQAGGDPPRVRAAQLCVSG